MQVAEAAEGMVKRMTMDDIKAMTEDWITPATAASAMKMDPGRLIEYARTGQLPFATQISGNRVKIGRKSFLKAYGYQEEEKQKTDRLEVIETELHTVTLLLMTILMKMDPDFTAFMSKKEAAQ